VSADAAVPHRDTRDRLGLIRHRDFRLLWIGQSVSDVGTSVSYVVVPLVAIVYLHATAFEVGVLSALEWLPWLLIGLPAGVWVDRSRSRPLLIWCDAVRLVLMGSVPLAAAFDALTIGQLFAVALLAGLATVVFQVAYQSYLPELIARDDLGEGNAKLQGSQAVANVVGPGIGGLLVQLFRAPFALVVDAASYLISVFALLGIRAREPAPVGMAERSLRNEIAEGARYVRRDPLLRVLTISPAIGNCFFIGYEAIVVLFLVRSVHLEPGTVGVLLALVGLGAVIGAAIARPVARWIGTSRAVWVGMAVTSPFALLIPLTSRGFGLAFFVIGNVMVFIGVLVYNVTISAFRQAYCPPQLLGRVVATMRFVLFGTMPLGALLGGTLASLLGPRTAVWLLIIGNLIPIFVLYFSPLRTMRDLPDNPPAWPESDQV
jgi:predicted MFS family arabinose efflux permease